MTVLEAKQVFASMMQVSRKRALTAHEKSELTKARQVLRQAKKPARNPRVTRKTFNDAVQYVMSMRPKMSKQTARQLIRWTGTHEQGRLDAMRAFDAMRHDNDAFKSRKNPRQPAYRTPSGDRKDFAYRGYTVTWIPVQEMFAISKDGFHIVWAKSAEEAKRQIDMIANPKRKIKPKSNPRNVKIYGRILRIEAQKTQPHHCDAECKRAKHRYYHDFTTRNASIYGMPDGSLVVKS